MNNVEKKSQYAILMNKLKKATYEEFYYEAIFIEYAILEERTESILRHANIKTIKSNGAALSINEKLNKLKSREEFQENYIKKHLSKKLLEELYNWKEKRNKFIHALVKNKYDEQELKNVALEGECLAKKLASKSQLVNKYLNKKLGE